MTIRMSAVVSAAVLVFSAAAPPVGAQARDARWAQDVRAPAALAARLHVLSDSAGVRHNELPVARAADAARRDTSAAAPRRAWEGEEALPAHTDIRVTPDIGLADWMRGVLAAIGTALAWLLLARGPFV